ncbi:hypothetical protein [Pseudomonas poae]|uniref:hypothetical protein n=1 Tax=Pseudomonas poae TaxID=200451 RepID=UPI0011B0A0AE|nr:hypothetical protein [Pseudomonas poae]
MRVPIYPQDLNSGSGFARIAKCLKRDWPGTEPIRLSEAQNLLAKSFGYSDYHQLRSSSPEGVPCPSVATVVAHCMMTLSSELIGDGRALFFDLGELHMQVINWPYLQLSVYRERYGHSDNRIVGQAANAELIDAFLATQKTRPELQSSGLTDKLSRRKLAAMVGHHPEMSTEAYMSTPMGVCSDTTRASTGMQCQPCGPANAQKRY